MITSYTNENNTQLKLLIQSVTVWSDSQEYHPETYTPIEQAKIVKLFAKFFLKTFTTQRDREVNHTLQISFYKCISFLEHILKFSWFLELYTYIQNMFVYCLSEICKEEEKKLKELFASNLRNWRVDVCDRSNSIQAFGQR